MDDGYRKVVGVVVVIKNQMIVKMMMKMGMMWIRKLPNYNKHYQERLSSQWRVACLVFRVACHSCQVIAS